MMALYSISIYTRPTVSSKVSDRKRLDGYQNGKSQPGGGGGDQVLTNAANMAHLNIPQLVGDIFLTAIG